MSAAPVQAIVLGGSAGSVHALEAILPALPADFPPVLVVVHVLRASPSLLGSLFAPRCAMRVVEASAFEPILPGGIYFAPSDYHIAVEPDFRLSLSLEAPFNFSRPSIDILFESAADAYGAGVVGVVLTGANADGAAGLRAIRAAGGRAWVQDPSGAESPEMPLAALAAVPDARVVPLARMATELRLLRGDE